MEKNGSEKQLLEKIGELAFCRSNDAVKLAFLREDAAELIDGMDLSALTELHRLSNGTVELKFIDRIKLLELLERAGARSAEAGTAALVAAIETAADRLPERPEGTEDPDAAP